MSSYKLNVSFSDEALHTIYMSGLKLALVKAVQGNAGNPVVWVATLPFENNQIEWDEN